MRQNAEKRTSRRCEESGSAHRNTGVHAFGKYAENFPKTFSNTHALDWMHDFENEIMISKEWYESSFEYCVERSIPSLASDCTASRVRYNRLQAMVSNSRCSTFERSLVEIRQNYLSSYRSRDNLANSYSRSFL